MSTAIVLFSHGSLLCGSGEALKRHAARLREQCLASLVEIGYLNYSEPLFATTVAGCVSRGVDTIVVAPYFLVPGYFVKVDLPKCLEAARAAHPEVTFITAEPIGFDERLADAMIEAANRPMDRLQWRDDLIEAPRYCRSNPSCPLYGTPICPAGKEIAPAIGLACVQSVQSAETEPSDRKRALLVMVHGTLRPIANAEMHRVVEVIRERAVFPIVDVGFMECNQPSIPEAIESCIGKGAHSVVAVPYFLHTGTHVADDLPTLIEEAERNHPDIGFAMGSYLGQSPRLSDILADRIRATYNHKIH